MTGLIQAYLATRLLGLMLLMSSLILSGCSTPSVPSTRTDGPTVPTTALQREDAESLVLALPEIRRYDEAVRQKGNKLFFKTEETPSRFVIKVGEDRGDRVVFTHWYLVRKNDKIVTMWDMSKGPLPKD